MRDFLRGGAVLVAAFLLACSGGDDGSGGGGGTPGGSGGSGGSGGHVAPQATALRVEPAQLSLIEGESRQLSAIATYDDASEAEAAVTWSVEGAAISVAEGGLLTAAAPGSATVTAQLGELSATSAVTVTEAPISRIALRAEGEWKSGTTVQLVVSAFYAGGRQVDLTDGFTFTISDPRVATVDPSGLATVLAGGPAAIEARVGSLTAVLPVVVTCDYPRYSAQLQYDRVMPPLSWPARWPDGTDFDLQLEEVYCNADWSEIRTLIFVVGAGWCTPCTLYAQRLELETAALSSLHAQIIFVEAQDTDGLPSDLEFAYHHLARITGEIPGIVCGDAETRPTPSFVQDSAIVRAFPSVFVVRTRDMKLIADQNRTDYYLPLQAIAADPEADWGNPGLPSFTSTCGAGDEEATEPNDLPEEATAIGAGTYTGGICTDAPDFYSIELDGPWRLQLDFTQATGDLDVTVWDVARNQPLSVNGQIVGSTGVTGTEAFDFQGRVIVSVQGYQHASAPYVLTLSTR